MSVEETYCDLDDPRAAEAARDRLVRRIQGIRLPATASDLSRDLLTNLKRHAGNLDAKTINRTLVQIKRAAVAAH